MVSMMVRAWSAETTPAVTAAARAGSGAGSTSPVNATEG